MSSKKMGGSLEGKVETVELALLNVDESYQRAVKRHHKVIAESFDPAAAGILHVGRRGDLSLWIIDGQQRREAMMKLGLTKWRALVIHSSGPQYEAQVYKNLNSSTTRKGLTSGELFKACLTAKDPVAEAVMRAVSSADMRVSMCRRGSNGWPEMTCVGLLYKLVLRWGEDLVGKALKIMAKTWPGQKEVLGEGFVYSICYLLGTQADIFDQARFEEMLSVVPPRQILVEAASQLGSKYAGCTAAICFHYNKRLRNVKHKLRLITEDEEVA